ncbi:pseudouridine synthase, putative [Babesia ovata]|uniref:Pseudouridine synthase, putative n=1 Tax=Babesia ovata TaxID=189622 RepID=A0A2H6KCK9_9APIC|nr:pseudouridine synthase, putative [Babesia ovata]GBE60736.1 pseudouridine synthase, putative [Babesia ovata]
MSYLQNEIRVVLTGPSNRFFVAYKPYGWFLTTPFDPRFGEAVMAPVLAAKLGVSPKDISFPGKLAARESGLVIGCTDTAMHNKIEATLKNGQCSMSYQCIVHANRSANTALIRRSPFSHAFACYNHHEGVSSGVVTFDVRRQTKVEPLKRLSALSDERLRNVLSQFLARSRVVSVHDVSVKRKDAKIISDGEESGFSDTGSSKHNCPGSDEVGDAGKTDSSIGQDNITGTTETVDEGFTKTANTSTAADSQQNGGYSFAYIMENLRDYLKRTAEDGTTQHRRVGNNSHNTRDDKDRRNALSQFRHVEIATGNHMVNKHMVEVLSSMGLVVLTGPPHQNTSKIRATVDSACLELCALQFPHPIYRDRVIEARLHEGDPVVPEEWVRLALNSSCGVP